MGTSRTIEELQRRSHMFQEWIWGQRSSFEHSIEPQKAALQARIREHYTVCPDQVSLLSGRFEHITIEDEWSVNSINGTIDACCKALFEARPPLGTVQHQPEGESGKALQALSDLQLLFSNAAFSLTQDLLARLQNDTEIAISTGNRKLGPGITLFLSVLERVSLAKEFIGSEPVIHNLFFFDVRFSSSESEADRSGWSDQQAYKEQALQLRALRQEIDRQVQQLDLSRAADLARSSRLASVSQTLDERMAAVENWLLGLRRW